jgi:hypothetical protein
MVIDSFLALCARYASRGKYRRIETRVEKLEMDEQFTGKNMGSSKSAPIIYRKRHPIFARYAPVITMNFRFGAV